MNFTNYSSPSILTNIPPISIDNTKELMQEYCSVINQKIIIVIGIAALMWLLQPKVYEAIDKIEYNNRFVEEVFGKGNLKIIYKWIGVGLLFIVGYMLWVMS